MSNTWDRIEECNEMWRLLIAGENLALFAPRRLGKTWLMQNLLLPQAEARGWQAIYCDLQADTSCSDAVLEIIRSVQAASSLENRLLSRVRAKFSDLENGNVSSFKDLLNSTDWATLLRAVLEDLNKQQTPCVIMLDEVTVCVTHIIVNNDADGRNFLNTLRKIRNEYKNIRWILTGSIGIDNLVDEYKMVGAINDLSPVTIEAFAPEIARDFTDHICSSSLVKNKFELESSSHQRLQQRLGWLSPFYIERLCRLIEPADPPNDGSLIATGADIDAACKRLLSHPYNRAFKSWLDHIDRNISEQYQGACKAILDFLCESPEGELRDTIRHRIEPNHNAEKIKQALAVLVSDGFLIYTDDARYQFVLPLLANYWQQFEL